MAQQDDLEPSWSVGLLTMMRHASPANNLLRPSNLLFFDTLLLQLDVHVHVWPPARRRAEPPGWFWRCSQKGMLQPLLSARYQVKLPPEVDQTCRGTLPYVRTMKTFTRVAAISASTCLSYLAVQDPAIKTVADRLCCLQDAWNRPISSAPDAWIDVLERTPVDRQRWESS